MVNTIGILFLRVKPPYVIGSIVKSNKMQPLKI